MPPVCRPDDPQRRGFLLAIGGLAAAATMPLSAAAAAAPLLRAIPSSGERIPAIGLGSWLTLDVGEDPRRRASRLSVLQAFFAEGGGLIDSSPMYGTAEEVIGWCLGRLPDRPNLFAATKVWTVGREEGRQQMENSRRLWGLPRFDLIQVHNLLDWEVQLDTLKAMQAEGRVRYIGVTTSHGRRHTELERILLREPLDFVQFTYNVVDREAEARLLPLAQERGIAVIVNRPFRGGSLFRTVWGRPLPAWAGEIGCANWAQVFLKFVLSHPAVTCAIPATSRADHLLENVGARFGALPDAALRRRISAQFDSL